MHKKKTFFSTIVVILFFICGINVSATSYYVSNSGNDAANGTSPATAWKTISKINSTTFSPGDSIKFRCGDRWFEALTLTESGTSSAYITITSYGTGAKPKLYGSKAVTSFTKLPGYDNVYRLNELVDYDLYYGIPGSSSRASIIWKISGDDTRYWSSRQTSFAELSSNYDYYWQNDSVYVYYDGDINNVDTLEVMQLAWGITLGNGAGGEYITIEGLDLQFWASRCIGMYNYPEITKHGFQLRNCHLAYTASREDAVGYGVAIAYCDMIIENNDAHDNGRRNISLNLVANTSDAIMRDVIVRNNTLHDGYHTTGVDMSMHSPDNYVRNIHICNNLIYDRYEGNGHPSESVFLQNYEGAAPKDHYDSIYIYNNIILNTTLDGVYLEYIGDHVYIINNTMTGGWIDETQSWLQTRAFVFYTTSGGHLTVMNNIFCNYTGNSVESFDGASDGGSVPDTFDYNLNYSAQNPNASFIWTDVPGSGTDWYWSQYDNLAANGYEVNSPDPAPPCMMDSTGTTAESAVLRSSSPAIGAGNSISFVTTDYFGNVRDPLHPTIGAIEYNPDIPHGEKLVRLQNSSPLIYPNPVTNVLYIDLAYSSTIRLMDVTGKILCEKTNSDIRESINCSSMQSGIYVVQILTEDHAVYTDKIIVK
ncbi:MAG: T9SS type A sorting domain-containing protein [Bacteroidales bacterium]|nr:T9SS type A sorting domain-containing protein [Bacteroidales bacterium]